VPEIHADFSHGIVRDTSREALPPGAVYDSTDFLLHRPGLAEKRGGTRTAGPSMTAATFAGSVAQVTYASGPQLLAVGNNGHLYTVTSGATTDVSTLGTSFASSASLAQVHRPVPVQSSAAMLAVFLAWDGTTAPKKWDGAAAANLGGTPPAAIVGAVYKQRLVLGNTNANPNRVLFSEVPSVESTWDTANKYLDTEQTVSGLAALPNVLLVFHQGFTERIIGSIPPGAAGADMDKALAWNVGCTDHRSIVVNDGLCYFANPRGVYVTNGSTPESLTKQGGIDTYWQNLFLTYAKDRWIVSTGIMRQFLFVAVVDNNGALVTSLMCYLPTRAWWRLTNVIPTMFAGASFTGTSGMADSLYYADRANNRVVDIEAIFRPAGGFRNDADGTAVQPMIEFAPFGSGPGVKSYGFGRIDYAMPDVSGDNPTLAITVKDGIKAETSFTPAESPLAETSSNGGVYPSGRARFSICRDAQSMTVRVTQTHASSNTEIYAVEVEQRPQSMVGDGIS
jgi:hypothetical protein